jgi:hypothetical protein
MRGDVLLTTTFDYRPPNGKDRPSMSRAPVAAVLCALLLAAAPAFADGPGKPPDAAKVRVAAEQFDAGMAALKAKDFEGAASHFEAADAAVASKEALRQAIRARDKAGQASRAATLASLALARHASDDATAKLSREILEKYEPTLHKLTVTCASPCVLAVGTRSVPGEAATRWTVYLEPGSDQLAASFAGGASSAPRSINAKAGGLEEVRFAPIEVKAPPPPPPPPPLPVEPEKPKEEPPPPPKGISPVFFGIGAAATVGLGATMIWSAVDTQTNPGPDAVKKACAGQGETCALYQDALAKQRRTNILIGTAAGTGAVTVVLAIFTRWRSKAQPASDPAAATLVPSVAVYDRGAVLGAAGSF